MARPTQRIINSVAPIRICDNGGWTDTWFAQYGKVFNLAVYPYAEVQLRVQPTRGSKSANRQRITILAENYGERYTIKMPKGQYDKHPLLEAAIDYMKLPRGVDIEVAIYSEAPAGGSTGTSAAVSVALIGALDRLRGGYLTAHEIALTAQRIETELLKQQCGIQDQIASAFGGINLIDMYQYPHASVSQIAVPNSIWWELEARLALVFVGQSHSSSKVHEKVIRELENAGPQARKLKPLRTTAERSRDALCRGDFTELGQVMIDNTNFQRGLHDELVGPHHQQIIEVAKAHGAIGWKVNGAGGDGGSVTLLCGPDRAVKRGMLAAIKQTNSQYQYVPTYLSRQGLRVWESPKL